MVQGPESTQEQVRIWPLYPRPRSGRLTLAAPEGYGMPVLGAAEEVLAQVRKEPARLGEPDARRGIRAEYLGAVESCLGENVVRVAAGVRRPVPHLVIPGRIR
jgi:hypothetical protein